MITGRWIRSRVAVDMLRRSLAAALAIGLLAAACATYDAEVRADDSVPRGAPLDSATLDSATIERWSARWSEHEPGSYSFVLSNDCECQAQGTFRVWVVGDQVVHTQALHDDAEPFRSYRGSSVDEVFAMFREALMVHEEEGAAGAGATASFTPQGLPERFTVSWTEGEPFLVGTISELTPDPPLPPGAGVDPNLFIVVSNQSYDEPEMPVEVVVDGTTVVDTALLVRDQHEFISYELAVAPGTHTLRATSRSGAIRTETVVVPPGEQQHLYLGYWSGADSSGGPRFDFESSPEPLGFA